MKRPLFALLATALAVSCANSPPPPPAAPHALLRQMAAEPGPPAPAPPPVAAPAPPAPEPQKEPAPCSKLTWVDACEPPAPHGEGARLSSDEVGAWFAERKAKRPNDLRDSDCEIVHVGPDREEALACARLGQPSRGKPTSLDHVFRLTADWVVVAARAKRAQTLASIRYVVDVLDKEMEGGALFAMGVVLDAGGERIAVMEPAEGGCARARSYLAAEKKEAATMEDRDGRRTMTAWAQFDAGLLEGLCRQPRVLVWKAGRFRPPAGGVVSSQTRGTSGGVTTELW